jgi:hypothetical protein
MSSRVHVRPRLRARAQASAARRVGPQFRDARTRRPFEGRGSVLEWDAHVAPQSTLQAAVLPQARRGPERLWTQERLYEELELFTAGREDWPTQAEFRPASRDDADTHRC